MSSQRRRQWQPTPVLLPGKSHGWRSLVGCSPSGCYESDTTEWLHFHFSLSHIGEGNGNPLQCSCLENPRDGGAWWAAVHGVAQGLTWLKWLSSSSSSPHKNGGCFISAIITATRTISIFVCRQHRLPQLISVGYGKTSTSSHKGLIEWNTQVRWFLVSLQKQKVHDAPRTQSSGLIGKETF